MNDDWTDLPSIETVALAKSKGWEIEHSLKGAIWDFWGGDGWAKSLKYRGRPAQPKTSRKVKLLGWFNGDQLFWLRDGAEPKWPSNRVPGEDKTVWVLE